MSRKNLIRKIRATEDRLHYQYRMLGEQREACSEKIRQVNPMVRLTFAFGSGFAAGYVSHRLGHALPNIAFRTYRVFRLYRIFSYS